MSVSRHFLLQAPQCPCSVRKRFSRDHCCRGRSKPCCRIVGSHTRCSHLNARTHSLYCIHSQCRSVRSAIAVCREFDVAKFSSDAADQRQQVLLSSGDRRRSDGVQQFPEPCVTTLVRLASHQRAAADRVSGLLDVML